MSDAALVPVEGVPCPHGGEHPDGHVYALRPKIGLVGATVALQRVREAFPDMALIKAALAEEYIRHGVVEVDGQAATDEDREALLADETSGRVVVDQADALYSDSVLAPLVIAASEFSETGPTNGSTSAPPASSPKRRRRSKRSSTTTFQMDDTEPTTTLPAGGSSSSPT